MQWSRKWFSACSMPRLGKTQNCFSFFPFSRRTGPLHRTHSSQLIRTHITVCSVCTRALTTCSPNINKINKQFRYVSGILWITKTDSVFFAHCEPHTNKCTNENNSIGEQWTHMWIFFSIKYSQELRLIDF